MGDERLTEGSICDINVAYNSKRVGYTTSMSYMNELCEINRPKEIIYTTAVEGNKNSLKKEDN